MENANSWSQSDIERYYKAELPSLEPSKSSANQAMAKCPFHNDKKASLSINLEKGLFKCHGCNAKGNLVQFHAKKHGMNTKSAYKALIEKFASEGGAMAVPRKKVKIYNYRDTNKNILYRKVRYEPKGFSLERPDGNGGWVNSLKDVKKVPYNLPEVIKARKILVVEGEKDVETLKRLGFTPKRDYAATTNPMGAGEKWEQEYANYLKGKNVVILPDNDEAGRKHAENVALSIEGVARSIKKLELPGLEEKGDVTDWLTINGGYKGEKNRKALRKSLLRLIEQAKPLKFGLFSQLLKASDLRKMNKKVQWVIDKIIPQHSVTLLHGSGGIGKTWLAMMMAEKVARGKSFLGYRTKKLRAIYVDFENSLELASDRADKLSMSKVRFFHNGSLPKPPQLDGNDWEKYKTLPKNSLLIIDTLRASQDFDENSSKDMAVVFKRLKELRDLGFTIVVLHHTPKSNKKTYKGSTAILDLADHVLSLHKTGTSDNSGGGAISDNEDSGKKNTFEFCTMEKTRYETFRVCLQLKKDVGFMRAPDPNHEDLSRLLEVLINHIKKQNKPPNQSKLIEVANDKLGLKKGRVRDLLKEGEGKYWDVVKANKKNASTYIPKDAPKTPIPGLEKKVKKHKSGTGGYSTDISAKQGASTKRTKNKTTKPRKHIRLVEARSSVELGSPSHVSRKTCRGTQQRRWK